MTKAKRKEISRKGGRSRSPAKVAAVRENGAKGGRPASSLPQDLLDKLGDPPTDPLALPGWYSVAIAAVSRLRMRGEGGHLSSLAQELRADARAAKAMIPPERLYQAEQNVLRRTKQEAEDVGPELEEVDGAASAPVRGHAPRGR